MSQYFGVVCSVIRTREAPCFLVSSTMLSSTNWGRSGSVFLSFLFLRAFFFEINQGGEAKARAWTGRISLITNVLGLLAIDNKLELMESLELQPTLRPDRSCELDLISV